MRSSSQLSKQDPEKRPNAKAKSMQQPWLQMTMRTLKSMLSDRVLHKIGNPQGSTNRLARTTSSSSKINLGNQLAKVTILTEMDRRAFSARCRTTVKKTAERRSRPTSLA